MSCEAYERRAHCDCSPCCLCAHEKLQRKLARQEPEQKLLAGVIAENDRLREKLTKLEGHVRDARNRADAERRQRHHDVLCIAFEALMQREMLPSQAAHEARYTADLAYPPPKETP